MVGVTTYLGGDEKISIDVLSKTIIFIECTIGLNRFPLIGNVFLANALLVIYALFINSFVIYLHVIAVRPYLVTIVVNLKLAQFTFGTFFSHMTWKRLQRYYRKLHKIDTEVGCEPKITWQSIGICVQLCIMLLATIIAYVMHYRFYDIVKAMPIHFVQIIENYYYGHLINLLTSRLRLLNSFIATSLTATVKTPSKDLLNCAGVDTEMNKLLNIYRTIVKAHDVLIDAIKWQLFVIITTSFAYVLILFYYVASGMLLNKAGVHLTTNAALTASEFFPLFVPCLSCDQLRSEVQRFRELLASKLYEGKLDKSNRSAARTLLALTEARDLSVSLLRIVDISIALPFKFMGLLVTYLIIMLQFNKVINP